jgi:hypothetical protein
MHEALEPTQGTGWVPGHEGSNLASLRAIGCRAVLGVVAGRNVQAMLAEGDGDADRSRRAETVGGHDATGVRNRLAGCTPSRTISDGTDSTGDSGGRVVGFPMRPRARGS